MLLRTFLAALLALPAAAQDLTVSHGISSFGALKYPPDFTHFDYANPGAPRGGTLSFRGTGASSTFDSLNPFILKGEPAQGLLRLYDTLMARAYDEPDAVYGLLAESVEHPADRAYLIFDLRPEARFHDGHPVTAEDVVFTYETLKAQGAPNYRLALKDVARVTALSDHRVRIDLREGAPIKTFAAEAGTFPILPRHYYDAVTFDASTLDAPLGSGPFEVADVDPGRRITYCRTEDYWGADLPVNRGTDNFDCVRYEYFTDRTAAFEAFKVGQYVVHEEVSSALWATGYDFPAVEKGWILREEIPDGRPSGAQGFWLNLRRDKFADIRVREAIAGLFNFEWSNQTLFHGLYSRTDSFWENSDLQATGMAEGAELAVLEEFRDALPEEVFTEPAHVPPAGSARPTDRSAMRAASALLDAAGWVAGADGLRRKDGTVLRVEIVYDGPGFERVVLPYVENLKRVGIDARSVLVDPAQMEERQERFAYDMTPGRFAMPQTPGSELRYLFGSESRDAPGSFNLSGLADPVVDALIEKVIAAETREDLRARVRALDRVLRARHIWVPNWYKGTHWLAYWDMFDRPATLPRYDRGVDFWWLDAERRDRLRELGALR